MGASTVNIEHLHFSDGGLDCSKALQRGRCSVICTTYNHARYSRDALISIAEQDWESVEIIVVDDGSTDENASVILTSLLELNRPFTLLNQENSGNPASNANRALSVANGEFCCLMSLDDLLLPGSISSKLSTMTTDMRLMMVGNESYIEIKNSNPSTGIEVFNAVARGQHCDADRMLELEYMEIGTFLLQGTIFRTKFLKEIGGFDENVVGDDLHLRTKVWLAFQAHSELSFKFLPCPGFIYRRHESNINLNTLRQVQTVLAWREKYFANRPLPPIAQEWLVFYFNQCYSTGELAALGDLLQNYSEARRIHALYTGRWFHKLRVFLSKIVQKRKLDM